MIDWDVLIKPEKSEQIPGNEAECRNKTGFVGTENTQCRNTVNKHSYGFPKFVPTVPTQNEGGGGKNENHAPGEGGASDNYCATKTHSVNPIAMCLLLACCNKVTATKEDTKRRHSKQSGNFKLSRNQNKSDHGRYSARSMELIHTMSFTHSLNPQIKVQVVKGVGT